jgi:hypothetical protein
MVALSFIAGVCVGTAAGQRAPVGRLYFDVAGNDGMESSPRVGPTAQVNPELPDGGGRLFLYWQFGHEEQRMYAAGFDIEVFGGQLAQAYLYKPTLQLGMERWYSARPNPPETPGGGLASFFGANVFEVGLRNRAGFEQTDQQFDPIDGPFGSTLLGYVDVVNDSGVPAEVFFRGNLYGIAEQGGWPDDTVYFGFGDGAVRTISSISALADATIVPEPSSLTVLALTATGWLLRRRLTGRAFRRRHACRD